MTIKIRCDCGKKLLAREERVGKRVRCPHCRLSHVVPAVDSKSDAPNTMGNAPIPVRPGVRSEPQYAEPALDDPFLTDPSDQATPPTPRTSPTETRSTRTASPSLAPPKRRRHRKRILGTVMLVGAVIVMMGLLLSMNLPIPLFSPSESLDGIVNSGWLGEPENAIDLSYLPEDLYRVEFFRPAAFVETEIGQRTLADPGFKEPLEAMEAVSRIALSEVTSVTTGYLDPEQKSEAAGFTMTVSGFPRFVHVVRLKSDADLEEIRRRLNLSEAEDIDGTKIYPSKTSAAFMGMVSFGFFFPDRSTIVYGTLNEIRESARSDGLQTRQARFDGLEPECYYTAAEHDSDYDFMLGESLAVDENRLVMTTWIECHSEAEARRVHQSQQMVLAFGRKMMDNVRQSSPHKDRLPDSDQEVEDFIGAHAVEGDRIVHRYQGIGNPQTSIVISRLAVYLPFVAELRRDLIDQEGIANAPQVGEARQQQRPSQVFLDTIRAMNSAPASADALRKRMENETAKLDSFPAVEWASGKKTSLYTAIDPAEDAVQGEWRRLAGCLLCDSENSRSRMMIPIQPPEEYDFVVTFEQSALGKPVSLILPNGWGQSFSWQGGGLNSYFSFSIDGTPHHPGVVRLWKAMTTDDLHQLAVQVRKDRVRGVFDGRVIDQQLIDFKRLTTDGLHKLPNTAHLGLACDDPTIFHSIELIEK